MRWNAKLQWLPSRQGLLGKVRSLVWKVRDARRSRLLGRLDRLGYPSLPVLLERLQRGLPLPLRDEWKRSEDRYVSREVVLLAEAYRHALRHDEAMRDLWGRLHGLAENLRTEILRGRWDDYGRDVTPQARAALGLLENILALPAALEARKEFVQREEMGIPIDKPDQPALV